MNFVFATVVLSLFVFGGTSAEKSDHKNAANPNVTETNTMPAGGDVSAARTPAREAELPDAADWAYLDMISNNLNFSASNVSLGP